MSNQQSSHPNLADASKNGGSSKIGGSGPHGGQPNVELHEQDPMDELARIVAGENVSANEGHVSAAKDNLSNVQPLNTNSPQPQVMVPNIPNSASANSELQDLESQLMAELGEADVSEPETETTNSTETFAQFSQTDITTAAPESSEQSAEFDELDFDAALEAQLAQSTQVVDNSAAQEIAEIQTLGEPVLAMTSEKALPPQEASVPDHRDTGISDTHMREFSQSAVNSVDNITSLDIPQQQIPNEPLAEQSKVAQLHDTPDHSIGASDGTETFGANPEEIPTVAPASFDPPQHPENISPVQNSQFIPENTIPSASELPPATQNHANENHLEDEFESIFADEFSDELSGISQPEGTVNAHANTYVEQQENVPEQIPQTVSENYSQLEIEPPVQANIAAHPAGLTSNGVTEFTQNATEQPVGNLGANVGFEQDFISELDESSREDSLENFENDDQQLQSSSTGFRWKLMAGALFIALAAGAGVFYLGYGGSNIGGSGPVLVKADQGPFKIKPDDPGGKNIANQDQPVYDNLDGQTTAAEPQEKLVTDMEEPLSVAPRGATANASSNTTAPEKSGERLSSTAQRPTTTQGPFPIIKPRRVKTVTVRPDGTILSGESNLSALSSSVNTPVGLAPVGGDTSSVDGAVKTGKLPVPSMNPRFKKSTSEPSNIEIPPPTKEILEPVSAPVNSAPVEPVSRQASLQVPNTRSLKASEPISKIKTASIPQSPKPVVKTGAANSGYVVQVSSQRSPEAAKASFENLKRRFAGLLEGQQSEIRQAKVDGKGTFYRVRLPQASKSEASKFCTSFKAAGGSCFVTR